MRNMGTFYIGCRVESPLARERSVRLSKLLVDTGSDYTWVPKGALEIGIACEKKDLEFIMANGKKITRSVGFAIIRLDKYFTIDEVVFAQPDDLGLLGARTLTGLNLTVDPKRKRIVEGGPLLAAIVPRSKRPPEKMPDA